MLIVSMLNVFKLQLFIQGQRNCKKVCSGCSVYSRTGGILIIDTNKLSMLLCPSCNNNNVLSPLYIIPFSIILFFSPTIQLIKSSTFSSHPVENKVNPIINCWVVQAQGEASSGIQQLLGLKVNNNIYRPQGVRKKRSVKWFWRTSNFFCYMT